MERRKVETYTIFFTSLKYTFWLVSLAKQQENNTDVNLHEKTFFCSLAS